jgi:hypothetical protein
VVDYLETLLYEDRQLKDFEKVNTQWKPAKLELTAASWFAVKNRGQTKATRKLSKEGTPDIDKAFKAVQDQPGIQALREQGPGAYPGGIAAPRR